MAAGDITWLNVTLLASELNGKIAPLVQNVILGVVNSNITAGAWGSLTTVARTLYAAHMATMLRRKGQGGAVTSQSMGGISESYSPPPMNTELDATSYGQLYMSLARTRAFRAGFTTGMVPRKSGC